MRALAVAVFLASTGLGGCASLPDPHAHAAPGAPAAGASAAAGYAPYRFLVGEWNVGGEAGAPMAVARFRWGPKESYLWYSVSTLEGGVERPHFEGMLLWNGARGNLDMLLALDLAGGRIQEQGVVFAEPDGTVVRDITAVYSPGVALPPRGEVRAGPAGATLRFRQTFKAAGEGRILTALTRRDAQGWVPTFPGSDRLVMTRRHAG